MKNPRWTKQPGERIILSALLCIAAIRAHAQYDPPGGGWSWPTNLNSWSFTDTNTWQSDNGHIPISFTNLLGSEAGDLAASFSMLLDTTNPAWLQFNIIETNSATNLTIDAGTVLLWF